MTFVLYVRYYHTFQICSRFGQSCYRLFTSWKLGDAATAHCESIGHHMLTITSAEENRFVTDLVKEVYGSAGIWFVKLKNICDKDSFLSTFVKCAFLFHLPIILSILIVLGGLGRECKNI